MRWRPPEPALVERLLAGLQRLYPDATCALHHRNSYELLVATILSAQCTDARVNQVTPELFRRWPDAAALADADPEELIEVIRSTGFFNSKSRSLLGMARALVERHGGEVPRDLESMVQLPGVGRKTANVVLGTVFGIPSGVVVDTHVTRVTQRLGLTRESDPVKIESDLIEILPKRSWIDFGHRVIHHGRQICLARQPRCEVCPLSGDCNYFRDLSKAPRRRAEPRVRPARRRLATARRRRSVRPSSRPGRRAKRPAKRRSVRKLRR
jgi:endonuclease-3